jgi:hypothetical protein
VAVAWTLIVSVIMVRLEAAVHSYELLMSTTGSYTAGIAAALAFPLLDVGLIVAGNRIPPNRARILHGISYIWVLVLCCIVATQFRAQTLLTEYQFSTSAKYLQLVEQHRAAEIAGELRLLRCNGGGGPKALNPSAACAFLAAEQARISAPVEIGTQETIPAFTRRVFDEARQRECDNSDHRRIFNELRHVDPRHSQSTTADVLLAWLGLFPSPEAFDVLLAAVLLLILHVVAAGASWLIGVLPGRTGST